MLYGNTGNTQAPAHTGRNTQAVTHTHTRTHTHSLTHTHMRCLLSVVWELCSMTCFSRNNGYAISTPTKDQYRGDGIGQLLHLLDLLVFFTGWGHFVLIVALILLWTHWSNYPPYIFCNVFCVYIQVQMDLTLLSLSIKVFEFEFNVCFMQTYIYYETCDLTATCT